MKPAARQSAIVMGAVALLLTGCGGNNESTEAASEDVVLAKAGRTSPPGSTPGPIISLRPPTQPLRPNYSSHHFLNESELGTVATSPAYDSTGPMKPTIKPGNGNKASIKPKAQQSSYAHHPGNREKLSQYRARLIEGARHQKPIIGYQYAEQESARLAQQFGHDSGALAKVLNLRLYGSEYPTTPKPGEIAVLADKE